MEITKTATGRHHDTHIQEYSDMNTTKLHTESMDRDDSHREVPQEAVQLLDSIRCTIRRVNVPTIARTKYIYSKNKLQFSLKLNRENMH